MHSPEGASSCKFFIWNLALVLSANRDTRACVTAKLGADSALWSELDGSSWLAIRCLVSMAAVFTPEAADKRSWRSKLYQQHQLITNCTRVTVMAKPAGDRFLWLELDQSMAAVFTPIVADKRSWRSKFICKQHQLYFNCSDLINEGERAEWSMLPSLYQ